MQKQNNICLIANSDIAILIEKLKLNLWNLLIKEIKDNTDYNKLFDDIVDKINTCKDSVYINKTFSYTIIYSLYDLNEKEKSNLKLLFQKIFNKFDNYYYQPFFILLIEDEEKKNNLIEFIQSEEFKNIDIDQRNISCFISPSSSKSNQYNIELIKNKINKIYSFFFELGDEFSIGKKKYKFFIKRKKS